MRRALWATVTLAAAAGLTLWAQPRLHSQSQPEGKADRTGIRWEKTFEAAKARAGREGKPVFLLSMVGRLDEEFC